MDTVSVMKDLKFLDLIWIVVCVPFSVNLYILHYYKQLDGFKLQWVTVFVNAKATPKGAVQKLRGEKRGFFIHVYA